MKLLIAVIFMIIIAVDSSCKNSNDPSACMPGVQLRPAVYSASSAMEKRGCATKCIPPGSQFLEQNSWNNPRHIITCDMFSMCGIPKCASS